MKGSLRRGKPAGTPKERVRTAVFLSAVMPGLGQLSQGRWISAFVYAFAFTLLFILIMVTVLVPLVTNLSVALSFAADPTCQRPFVEVSFLRLFSLFGLCLIVYLAALIDAYRSQQRRTAERSGPLPSDSSAS